jgi:hypothetical protein
MSHKWCFFTPKNGGKNGENGEKIGKMVKNGENGDIEKYAKKTVFVTFYHIF